MNNLFFKLSLLSLISCHEFYKVTPQSSTPANELAGTHPLEVNLNESWAPHSAELVGYYHFDGNVGDSIPDNTFLNNIVGPIATVHQAGSALVLGPHNLGIHMGAASYIQLSGADADMSFSNNLNFSIQSWVKWTGTSSWGRIMSNGNFNYVNGWSLQVSPDLGCGVKYPGSFMTGLGAYGSNQSDTALVVTNDAYNDGNWHHVVVVFDQVSVTKEITVYVDGLKAAISSLPIVDTNSCTLLTTSCATVSDNVMDYSACNQASSGTAWGDTFIGNGRWAMYDPFPGSLSEPAIWGAALSASEVAVIYQHQKARSSR